jgi:GDP-L-fucose synthase
MAEAYRSQYGSDFINVMPTNLYGPGDNYHPEYSRVVPALIRRFHEAKAACASNAVVWVPARLGGNSSTSTISLMLASTR